MLSCQSVRGVAGIGNIFPSGQFSVELPGIGEVLVEAIEARAEVIFLNCTLFLEIVKKTFDDLVFLPGPNLNVVIGPNGNGKSSIICGICLAVGGDPRILGRSTKVCCYIKHGCETGFVELYIRDSQKSSDQRLRVVINKSKNASEYFINDSHVTRAEIRKVVTSYNIQIENPCTFLAQDKVRSFAEQSPNLLLKNTEKASSLELCEMHRRLEELEEIGANFSKTRSSLERKIAAITNELSSLEPIVKSYEERKKTLEKIEVLEKKDAVLNYQDAVTLHSEKESQLKRKCCERNKILKRITSADREFESKKDFFENTQKKLDSLNAQKQRLDETLETLLKSEPVGSKIKQARDDFEQAKKDCDNWKKDIEVIEKEITSLTEALNTARKDGEQASKEMAKARMEYENWRKKEEEVELQDREIRQLQIKIGRIKDELDEQTRKVQQLEACKMTILSNNAMSKRFNCLNAWKWYQEHHSYFQFPVYVPLLAINLKNGEYAKFLENVVASRDFLVFIFGCKEDEARLTNSSFPWKIASTIMTAEVVEKSSVEGGLPEHLRQYGFHHMISEMYDAPAPVKAYLNRLFHLNRIPIGDENTDRRLDEVCSAVKDQYRLFLTGTSRVRIRISRYTGEASIRTDSLRTNVVWLGAHQLPKDMLTDAEKAERLDSLTNMDNKMKELQRVYNKSREDVNVNIEKLRRKMTALRKQDDSAVSIEQQIKSRKIRLSMMEENMPNLEESKRKMEECKKTALAEGLAVANEIEDALKKSGRTIQDLVVEEMYSAIAKKEMDAIREKIRDCRAELSEKETEVNEQEEELETSRKALKDRSEELRDKIGLRSVDEKKMSSEERDIWKKLLTEFEVAAVPNDHEELRNELNAQKARLIAMHDEGDRAAIDRYQKLLEDNLNLKKHLDGSSGQIDEWESEIDMLLNKWITSLDALIENINKSFGDFFQRLGCAGEVCLDKPPNKHDISSYGIDIMVKFRSNEHLHRLSHQTQSGGERSVSTMLYLLAMQELCPVPFRCVDEINQGMDPNNEKMVFEMMVGLLSGVGNLSKTQYFLLTPKLLPGLYYGEKSVIHCIYNGATFPKKGINLNEHLGRARLLQSETCA